MKRTHKKNAHLSIVYPHYRRPFPNAAEPQYFINKLIDGILAMATGIGSLTIFFFLITM